MTEIQLSREFSEEFAEVQKRAEKGDGDAEYLLKLMDKGIARLVENYQAGQKVQKSLWPGIYVKKYGIHNLWRLRLDGCWRMLYTVMGDKVRIVAIILDVMDHREYDRRFGYK